MSQFGDFPLELPLWTGYQSALAVPQRMRKMSQGHAHFLCRASESSPVPWRTNGLRVRYFSRRG
jgi:hypothetical protein